MLPSRRRDVTEIVRDALTRMAVQACVRVGENEFDRSTRTMDGFNPRTHAREIGQTVDIWARKCRPRPLAPIQDKFERRLRSDRLLRDDIQQAWIGRLLPLESPGIKCLEQTACVGRGWHVCQQGKRGW